MSPSTNYTSITKMDKPSSNRSVYSLFELLNIPTPEWPSAVVLIVVAILFVLAFVYKQATQPVWQPPSQELSEKIRLYMAGSMVGNFTRKMFNTWTTSQEDPETSSNDDEKNERHPLDMPSSSSTSLSLPTHNVSPRLYKKASNSQLRRQSTRLKQQGQVPNVNTHPLAGSYISPSSSSNCSSDEHSPLPADREESKTTFTINVSEPLNNRNEQGIDLVAQENNDTQSVIPVKPSDYNDDTRSSAKSSQRYSLSESNLLNSMKNASPNMEGKSSVLLSSSNLSKEQNVSERFNFALSLNSRSDPMVALPQQESDAEVESIISDDHSEHTPTNLGFTPAPTEQKNAQEELNQDVRPSKTNRRRRKRTRGKNSNKQNNQREQVTQTEQRPLKQDQAVHTGNKQDITQQHSAESSRTRHIGEPARSMSFSGWQKTPRPQIHPQTYHQPPQAQLLNNSGLFSHLSKRNLPNYNQHHSGNTPVPATRATIPETSKKSNYQRADTLWRPNVPAASHVSLSRSNTIPTSAMRNSMSRFSYADVIAPNPGRSSTFTSTSQIKMTSMLSNSANITTPAPTASGINEDTTNNQWYSPFSSGFSIQLTPPASPRIGNNQLDGSVGNSSTFSLFSAGSPAPISAPTNNSSSDSSSSASFSSSLFGRKISMSEDDNRFM